MKRIITFVLCFIMVLGLCACGAKEEAPAVEAAPAAAPAAAPVAAAPVAAAPAASAAGAYTFTETNMNGLEILWTLTLNADGSYVLNEKNDLVGNLDYMGTTYSVEGDVVTCGVMTSGPAFYVWANPDGFTATLNADGTFTPDQEGLEGVETDALAGILEAASGEASGEASN